MTVSHTNFWSTLPRPIIGLAPMNGVTDHPFRHIQKKYGNPTLVFTEFTSVDGICAGANALLKDFLYDETQRPVIAQIYGKVPENFYRTALLLCELGFDGIDINMGCPSKSVAHAGAGAGLIRTPKLAQEIIRATQQAVRDWQNGATAADVQDVPVPLIAEVQARHARLPAAFRERRPIPVSVKTRIGYAESEVESWIPNLLECEPAALTLHGRTLVQGYTGDSNWDQIALAAELARDTATVMLGNGDVQTLTDAHARIEQAGTDGALIGRASYGNPYVFRPADDPVHPQAASGLPDPARYTILHIALEHARLYEASFGQMARYHFLPMRKHLGWYVRHLPGASHLRRTLTQTSSLRDAVAAIEEYLDYREVWEQGARVGAAVLAQ